MGVSVQKDQGSSEAALGQMQDPSQLVTFRVLPCRQDAHGKALSDEDIRAEADTFMFGGE